MINLVIRMIVQTCGYYLLMMIISPVVEVYLTPYFTFTTRQSSKYTVPYDRKAREQMDFISPFILKKER